MSKKILTEEDVKEKLGVVDFRSISKSKIIEFVSMIPNVDKDVALAIINQFPNYSNMANDMSNKLIELCDNAIKSDENSHKDAIEGYKVVLFSLKEQINNESLTEESRDKINTQMIDIADKIAAKDTERKQMIKSIIETGGKITLGVLSLGVIVLGVNIKTKK